MRLALFFALCASPVQAWQASSDGPICRLHHESPGAEVALSFDPALPEYAIRVTRDSAWPEAPEFAMRFDGPRPGYITTGRHGLSDAGRALTVTDRGFGNVLDGLEFNLRAIAMSGDIAVIIPLDGAGPAVAQFRACAEAPSA